jgi:hypothetical protein
MLQQDGLISRRQAGELGATPADLRRLLRRREWARVHPGVFINHTGRPTWQQRAWAAVLMAAPAALCGESALRAANGPGHRDHDDDGAIHVAVDRARTVIAPPQVVVHRLLDLEARTQWNLAPPRMRIEEAVIDVAASAADPLSAISVLADAVQSRRTTAQRLRRTLDARSRVARRPLLEKLLDDVATGACSALEHAYLRRVERPHGLPRAHRQVRASGRGPIYRDVVYPEEGVVVELDGRLDHTRVRDRDRDLDRDLDAVLDEKVSVRLGWGQTVGRPCVTAAKVARLLQRRGWDGAPRRCSECLRQEGVGFGSPGDSEPTRSAGAGGIRWEWPRDADRRQAQ